MKPKIVGDWKFHEDNSVFKIALDPEEGDFSIHLTGYDHTVRAKTLDEVRRLARDWMAENSGLDFKPVIIVEAGSSFHGDKVEAKGHDIQFKYDRAFTAIRKDGTRVWRNWEHVDDIPPGDDMNWNDTLEGRPGYVQARDLDATEVAIPYAKDKWLALRQVTRMMRALSRKLIEIREAGTMEKFLSDVFKRGPARLLDGKGPSA